MKFFVSSILCAAVLASSAFAQNQDMGSDQYAVTRPGYTTQVSCTDQKPGPIVLRPDGTICINCGVLSHTISELKPDKPYIIIPVPEELRPHPPKPCQKPQVYPPYPGGEYGSGCIQCVPINAARQAPQQ